MGPFFDLPCTRNMPKFLKPGKIAIVLQGKYAGRKALILNNFDEGTEQRKYGHAVVAGIDRYPLKVTRRMSKKKIAKRSKIKPFVKSLNYNHIMPTRYVLKDAAQNLRSSLGENCLEKGKRKQSRKIVRKVFEDRYQTTNTKYFFQKLRF